jgi:hypothetical protein
LLPSKERIKCIGNGTVIGPPLSLFVLTVI